MPMMRKAAVVLAGAALALTPTTAFAADNPAKKCADLQDLDLSRGACASTLAQNPDVDVTDPGAHFTPSGAAFIANCKDLESNGPEGFGFLVYDEGGNLVSGPYPYQFYAGMVDDAHADLFTAKNRAGCVRVLRGLHSGELLKFLLLSPSGV